MSVRILSAVPEQLTNLEEKLDWIDQACACHKPDILVTPQEFFGGAVMMPDQISFRFDELFPKLKKLVKKHNCGMVVGVVENIGEDNIEAVWFIDEAGEYLGRVVKFALPKYDHICTKGFGHITPETDFFNRFKVFTIQGVVVSAVFCWEAYSDILWTGLGLLRPDVVFNMIKFGVNSWPVVRKNTRTHTNDVVDFGYGTWAEDGRWVDRLHVANLWQVKCPIICTTNSWNLRPISMPLCGCISQIDGQAEHTLWHPKKEEKLKKIPEKIIVDEINPHAIRAALKNKFIYKELTGEWPPFSLGRLTMMLKINRIEDRVLSGRELKSVISANKKAGKLQKNTLNLTK